MTRRETMDEIILPPLASPPPQRTIPLLHSHALDQQLSLSLSVFFITKPPLAERDRSKQHTTRERTNEPSLAVAWRTVRDALPLLSCCCYCWRLAGGHVSSALRGKRSSCLPVAGSLARATAVPLWRHVLSSRDTRPRGMTIWYGDSSGCRRCTYDILGRMFLWRKEHKARGASESFSGKKERERTEKFWKKEEKVWFGGFWKKDKNIVFRNREGRWRWSLCSEIRERGNDVGLGGKV